MKPLTGLRVLDLTRVMAGPFCTALLADLGAQVIKLEPPQGDDYRAIGPFLQGESALFTLMNRGKQSITLDLKTDQGRTLAQQIAATCDVLVENFRPGVAAKLGLGPELCAANPRLIHASISGFGQTGPAAHLPAYDLVAQAMSGLMSLTGDAAGPPTKVGESYGDLMGGLYASWAILAALYQRQATGKGCTIDVAMFDALFSLLPTAHAVEFYGGKPATRTGNRHPISTPFGCFATADGQAVIAVLGPAQWSALCQIIGQPDAATLYPTDEIRTANEPAIKALIEAYTTRHPTAHITAQLSAAGIPTAPIQSLAQAAASPHAQHRDLVQHLPHHSLGLATTIGQPVRFNGEKPIAATSAPAQGQDTTAILSGIGLTPPQIAALYAANIVQGPK